MLGKIAAEVFGSGIAAINDRAKTEGSHIGAIFKRIAGHPFKVLAACITAPFLLTRIAWKAENPVRKVVALVGLLLSLAVAYVAATVLGSLTGALLVVSHIGILAGLGFFVGTTLSIYLSIIFSIIALNSVSFLFLKISSQEVLDYLNEIST